MSSPGSVSVDVKVAEQYKKVVDELKFGSEVRESDLTREYETKISTLKEEILMLTNLLKVKDRVSGDLVSSHLKAKDDVFQKLTDLTNRISEIQKKNKDLEQEKNDLLDHLEMLNALKETLEAENKKYSALGAEIEEERKKNKASGDAMVAQIADLNAKFADSVEEKKKFVASSTELNASLQKETEEKGAAVAALNVLQATHKDLVQRKETDDSRLASMAKNLQTALDEMVSLKAKLGALEKEKDAIEKMRYDIEKDHLVLRATIEKDVKLYHGIPFQPIDAEEEGEDTESLREKSGSDASGGDSAHSRTNSNASSQSDSPKIDGKVRKYFSNKKPFTVEFVSEKIKKLKQEDFLSAQALADAFSREILRNGDGQLSYICSDIGTLKFKYIDTKGKTRTDKNLSHLRTVAFPLIEASVRAKVEGERTITTREPNDVVIGQLLETLEGVSSKKNKQFVSVFVSSLAPKIAYVS